MTKGLNKEQRYYLEILKEKQFIDGGLYVAYKTPSQRKINVYDEIARQCYERNGYGLCVLTASSQFFTVGYFYLDPATREPRARIELPTRTLDFAVVE